jgi:type IV pilus assembly protein PilA
MQETLRRMREKRVGGDRGFTLIELLVVVVIIGVLVAIAVPVYLNYRKGAANKSAASDVRGAITAIEQYYTDNGNVYPADASSPAVGQEIVLAAQPNGAAQNIKVSPGNTVRYNNNTAAGVTEYWICAQNQDGQQTYIYRSTAGGSVAKTASTLTNCYNNGT